MRTLRYIAATAACAWVCGVQAQEPQQAGPEGAGLLPYVLPEVVVTAPAAAESADMPVSMHAVTAHQLQAAAGSLDDVARALSVLPGVAPMRFERHDLIVRGGAPMENLFLVDNIEFPTISHYAVQGAGAGSSSIVNTDFISRVSFSTGGFGARNGDKLSSVVALTLREGNRDRNVASATISATQFGMHLEGPIASAGSYLASLRRSYLEPVFTAYDMSFVPVYWDACAKVVFPIGGSDRAEVLAIGSRDRMRLINDTEEKRKNNATLVFSDQDLVTAGATWEHFTGTWYTRVTAANAWGAYVYYQHQADAAKSSRIETFENEASLAVDGVLQASGGTEIAAGVKGKFIRFRDDTRLSVVPWFLNVSTDFKTISRSIDTSGWKLSAYAQVTQTAGRFVVNAGIRADHFTLIGQQVTVAPRVSLRCMLSPSVEATGSAGRYYQAPASIWFANPFNMRLKPAGADHMIVGVTQRIGREWTVMIEGYRKTYFDYPVSIEAPCMTVFNAGSLGTNFKDFGLDSLVSRGTGTSQGIELTVQKHVSNSPFSGTLGVSYGKTTFAPLDGISRAADHDMRWVLNLVLEYAPVRTWGITGKFRIYTGHPYTDRWIMHNGTLDQYARNYNAVRVGVNHMLDVRVMRRWELRSARVEAFVDVQNLYNRKPLGVPEFDAATGRYLDSARGAGAVGIVPSVGINVSF